MIYTVTFNPSIDYVLSVDDLKMGMTNRAYGERTYPSGKGINVSVVLKNLGLESTALGFVSGFTGEEIVRGVNELGIGNDFIKIKDGFTRINVKIKNIDGMEINGAGPKISPDEVNLLMSKLNELVSGDILFLSGSIPASIPDDSYEKIMEMLDGRGVITIVDATKKLLMNVLPYKPFLIKPNNHEIGEIFGVELTTRESVVPYAKKLQELGAQNVLVSMAGEGAVLIAADGSVYSAPVPEGELVNAVGAGDSMVAGFMAGYLETGNYEHAFKMGLAGGSASAFSEDFATREEIEKLYKTINLR